MAVVVVNALHRYQIIAAKTFHTAGTDEVFPTSGSIHHVEGSRRGPSWSFKVNHPSIWGEFQVQKLRDNSAHIVINTVMATH